MVIFLFLFFGLTFSLQFTHKYYVGGDCDENNVIAYKTFDYTQVFTERDERITVEDDCYTWSVSRYQFNMTTRKMDIQNFTASYSFECSEKGIMYKEFDGEKNCDGEASREHLMLIAKECENIQKFGKIDQTFGMITKFSKTFVCDATIPNEFVHLSHYKDEVCTESPENRAINFYVKLNQCFAYDLDNENGKYFMVTKNSTGDEVLISTYLDDECTQIQGQSKQYRKGLCVAENLTTRRGIEEDVASFKFIGFGESEQEDPETNPEEDPGNIESSAISNFYSFSLLALVFIVLF